MPRPLPIDRSVLLGTAAIFGLAFATYAAAWGSFAGFARAVDACPQPFCDFVTIWLPMGRSLLEATTPVGGYLYTAFFACLLVPFAALPEGLAVASWAVLQALAAGLLFLLPCRRILAASRAAYFVYVAAFASSLPLLHNLKWGQVSVAMTLLVVAAATFARSHPVRSGALLAVSASVKFYTGAFALIPLLRRETRFLAAFALAGLVCAVLLPALWLGWDETLQFTTRVFVGIRDEEPYIERSPNSQYLVYVVSRWLGGGLGDGAARVLALVGVAVLLVHVHLALRLAEEEPREDLLHPWILVFLALPLVVRTSWPHYFSYLPLCQGVLAARLLAGRRGPTCRLLLGAPILASVLLSSSVLLLAPGYEAIVTSGSLLLANLLLIPVAYALLRPGRSRAPAPAQGAPDQGSARRSTSKGPIVRSGR